jgi:hypothetical protein
MQDRDTLPTLLLMKTKVITHKFKGQEDTRIMQDEAAAADAAADAVTPATPPHGGAAAAAGKVELPPASSTASGSAPPGGMGAASVQGVVGRMLGPKADAD